jgi:hypothetical protein
MRRHCTALLLAACSAGVLGAELDVLDLASMRTLIMSSDKVVILMHAGPCQRADEFAPRLAEIADRVPSMAYGRIDVNAEPKMAVPSSGGVLEGAPALKAFFRNAPPGKRVLEYSGPPTSEAVLEWVSAIDKWDGSHQIPEGFEVGGNEPSASSQKRSGKKRKQHQKNEV